MPSDLRITRIIVTHYATEIVDMALEETLGFDTVYNPGSRMPSSGNILTIETSEGVKGETPGGVDERAAHYLLGRNPLQREIIWHDLKRANRSANATPPGAVDIALWDIAGKLYNAPIHQLLGGWRTRLPAYASTYHGIATPRAGHCRGELPQSLSIRPVGDDERAATLCAPH